ncbi:MAG: PAS domain S-box protein [Methanomicrobiales archaeon]|nr:PAS domain S-box protein [Methanomicrobiales archaeon]
MILDQEKITRIKRLLKARPKGLTISDISHNLKINRNSVAKYLEILLITGQVEMRMYGNAKVYYLSNRVPISSMLKFTNELILVLDSEMRVIEANNNFFSYFPVKKEDLIGNPITASPVNAMDGFRIDDLARSSIETGELSREISLSQDGVIKYLVIKIVPSVFDDGSTGTTLIFEDITEKKEVEERLRVSEAKYRAIVEDQTEMVDRFDKDLNLLFVNPTILQYFGLEENELIGKSILEFIPREERSRIENCIRSLTPENPVGIVEHRSIDRDGKYHWLQWTNRALFDEQGNLVEYQGVGRDVTKQKESEQALLIKNFALASSLNGIGIADLSGMVTYANKSFLTLFGYEEEADVIGKPIQLFAHDDSDASGDIREVWTSLQDRGQWSGEVLGRKRSGATFNAVLNASVVRDQAKTPLCMMASFFDITEIKKTREELRLKDTAIASSLTAMAIFDRDFNPVYANDAFLSEFNLERAVLQGNQAPDIISTLFENPSIDEIIPLLKETGTWNGELSVTGKEGDMRYFNTSIRCSFDEQGAILYTLASLVNITEFRSIETALKGSRQKLSETIEFMPDPTFIVDRNHRIIAWNRALEMLSGVKRDEVLGKRDFQKAFSFFGDERPILVDILDLPPHELAKNFPQVRRFGDSIYVEAFIPAMNGGKGAYLWGKASALIDHEGHSIGAIESIRDISAWKRARESLRKMDASGMVVAAPSEDEQKKLENLDRMRQELESVLDLMEEAVLLTDKSGMILWANERFVELVDGDRQIVLGAPLSTFFPADEGQILSGPPGETTMRITLIPLTGNRILPVEAKTAGIPLGDERVVILQHIPS